MRAQFTIRSRPESFDSCTFDDAGVDEGNVLTTRRVLIALTFVLLVAVSIGVGVVVARWPDVRHVLFP